MLYLHTACVPLKRLHVFSHERSAAAITEDLASPPPSCWLRFPHPFLLSRFLSLCVRECVCFYFTLSSVVR